MPLKRKEFQRKKCVSNEGRECQKFLEFLELSLAIFQNSPFLVVVVGRGLKKLILIVCSY